jgi:hypothetical protein
MAALKLVMENSMGSQITFGLPRSSILENMEGISCMIG